MGLPSTIKVAACSSWKAKELERSVLRTLCEVLASEGSPGCSPSSYACEHVAQYAVLKNLTAWILARKVAGTRLCATHALYVRLQCDVKCAREGIVIADE